MKNLERFAAFNETLTTVEMQVIKGGQNMIKFSTEVSKEGTWVTEDHYQNGKYLYSATTADDCK